MYSIGVLIADVHCVDVLMTSTHYVCVLVAHVHSPLCTRTYLYRARPMQN